MVPRIVKRHSSNITRVTAGGNQLWICFKDNKTKTADNSRNNQWHPFHSTDLGPQHIGINHLLGGDQNDLPEVYLPPIGILTFKGHSAVSQQTSPTQLKPQAAQQTPQQSYLNSAQKHPKQTEQTHRSARQLRFHRRLRSHQRRKVSILQGVAILAWNNAERMVLWSRQIYRTYQSVVATNRCVSQFVHRRHKWRKIVSVTFTCVKPREFVRLIWS